MHNRILVAACLSVSTLLHAQDKPATVTPTVVRSTTGFVLAAGDHELRDIIKRAGDFLGRNYIFYPEEEANPMAANRGGGRRRGKAAAPGVESHHTITLQKRLILDAIACEEVVSQLAYSRGFVVVPLDALRGVYEVICLRGSRSALFFEHVEYLSPADVLKKARLRTRVATLVPMKHVLPTEAARVLQHVFVAQTGAGPKYAAVGETAVMIRGFATEVAAIVRMLQTLDVPSKSIAPVLINVEGQLLSLRRTLNQQRATIHALKQQLGRVQLLLAEKQSTDDKAKAPNSK